jgi:molybdopterin-guanine dinucleotide biosynthesis protein A
MMATGILLAGGMSTRMPGDKTLMRVGGRTVIEIELEVIDGLFGEVLIVCNKDRIEHLRRYESDAVRVVAEPVSGKGPLGGILSGLLLSGDRRNFVLACDMPFIKREAISAVVDALEGWQVAVPSTPAGLEPLHAAYDASCIPFIESQLAREDLKVTDFFSRVRVNYVPVEELLRFDATGRLLLNINEPEDMRLAAGSPDVQKGDAREDSQGQRD